MTSLGLDPKVEAELVADLLEQQIRTQARLTAVYYQTLRDQNVPLELCEQLTRVWHEQKLEFRFWLQPPPAKEQS